MSGESEVLSTFRSAVRLRSALEELLSVAERIRGGDPKLDPEEWYAIRDYARVVLKDTEAHF